MAPSGLPRLEQREAVLRRRAPGRSPPATTLAQRAPRRTGSGRGAVTRRKPSAQQRHLGRGVRSCRRRSEEQASASMDSSPLTRRCGRAGTASTRRSDVCSVDRQARCRRPTPRRRCSAASGCVERLGDGGMGAVYRAVHDRLGRVVAIKLLHKDLTSDRGLVGRFFAEARAANTIRHEHVVEVYDFVEDGDDVYFVMEYLKGEDLHDAIHRPSGADRPQARHALPGARVLDPRADRGRRCTRRTRATSCTATSSRRTSFSAGEGRARRLREDLRLRRRQAGPPRRSLDGPGRGAGHAGVHGARAGVGRRRRRPRRHLLARVHRLRDADAAADLRRRHAAEILGRPDHACSPLALRTHAPDAAAGARGGDHARAREGSGAAARRRRSPSPRASPARSARAGESPAAFRGPSAPDARGRRRRTLDGPGAARACARQRARALRDADRRLARSSRRCSSAPWSAASGAARAPRRRRLPPPAAPRRRRARRHS